MKKITIIAGHYGAGKTNVAVALALKARQKHDNVLLADLDTVNPYFRAADCSRLLTENGITPLIPVYANTNVDIPSLPESFRSVFDTDAYSVFDVGGDDDGATVLRCYKKEIETCGYDMFFVFNMYRPMTPVPEAARDYLRAIEVSSGLRFTALINNSNLGDETTAKTVLDSSEYSSSLSALTGLEVRYTTALRSLSPELDGMDGITYIENTTKRLF